MADLGDVLPFSARLYSAPPDEGGVLVNALSSALVVTLPDGSTVTPTLPGPTSTGLYQYDYVAAMAGRYVGRWLFTFSGGKTTAYVETFDVRPTDPGYILSLSDAKRALNIDRTDTSNDEELRSMIESVSNALELITGDVVARRTVVEQFTIGPRWARFNTWETRYGAAYKLLLAKRPVLAVTSIVRPLDGVTWTGTDVTILNATTGVVVANLSPFWGDLVATYTAGYTVIPANYIEAAKIILRHLWDVQQTPGMGSGVFNTGGDMTGANPAYAIPNRAIELLGGRGITMA